MKTLRKVLFCLVEGIALVSFMLLMCVSEDTPFKYIFYLFLGFAFSACIAVVLDNPHRIFRFVFPAIICFLAIIHAILRPVIRLCAACYKTMKKSGSVVYCFLDCKDKYDDWAESKASKTTTKTKAGKHYSTTTYRHTSSKTVDFAEHVMNMKEG